MHLADRIQEPPPEEFLGLGLFDDEGVVPAPPPPPPVVAVAGLPLPKAGLDLKPGVSLGNYVEYVPTDPPVTLSAAMNAIPVMTIPYGGLVVSKDHLNKSIKQIYEDPKLLEQLKDVDSRELLKYVKEPAWAEAMKAALIHACDYSGNQAFQTVAAMEHNLKALTDYAESNVETMGAGMKGKV